MIIKLITICAILESYFALTEVNNAHPNVPFGWRLVKINRRLTNSNNQHEVKNELNVSLSSRREKLFDKTLIEKNKTESQPVSLGVDLEVPPIEINKVKDKKEEINNGKKNENEEFSEREIEKYFLPKPSNLNEKLINSNSDVFGKTITSSISLVNKSNTNKINTHVNQEINEFETRSEGIKNFLPKTVQVINFSSQKEYNTNEQNLFAEEELNKYFLPKLKISNNKIFLDINQKTNKDVKESDSKTNIDFNETSNLEGLRKEILPEKKVENTVQVVSFSDEDKKNEKNVFTKEELNKYFLPTIKSTNNKIFLDINHEKNKDVKNFDFKINTFVKEINNFQKINKDILPQNKVEEKVHVISSSDEDKNKKNEKNVFTNEELNQYFLPTIKSTNTKIFLDINQKTNKDVKNFDSKINTLFKEMSNFEEIRKDILPQNKGVEKVQVISVSNEDKNRKSENVFSEEELNKYFLPKPKTTNNNIFLDINQNINKDVKESDSKTNIDINEIANLEGLGKEILPEKKIENTVQVVSFSEEKENKKKDENIFTEENINKYLLPIINTSNNKIFLDINQKTNKDVKNFDSKINTFVKEINNFQEIKKDTLSKNKVDEKVQVITFSDENKNKKSEENIFSEEKLNKYFLPKIKTTKNNKIFLDINQKTNNDEKKSDSKTNTFFKEINNFEDTKKGILSQNNVEEIIQKKKEDNIIIKNKESNKVINTSTYITKEEVEKYFLPNVNQFENFLKTNQFIEKTKNTTHEINKQFNTKITNIKIKEEVTKNTKTKNFHSNDASKNTLPIETNVRDLFKSNKNEEKNHFTEEELNKYFLPQPIGFNVFLIDTKKAINEASEEKRNQSIKNIEKGDKNLSHQKTDNLSNKNQNVYVTNEELDKYFLPKRQYSVKFLDTQDKQTTKTNLFTHKQFITKEQNEKLTEHEQKLENNKSFLPAVIKKLKEEDLNKYFLPNENSSYSFLILNKPVKKIIEENQINIETTNKKKYKKIDLNEDEINKFFLPAKENVNNKFVLPQEQHQINEDLLKKFFLPKITQNENFASNNKNILHDVKESSKEESTNNITTSILNKYFIPNINLKQDFKSEFEHRESISVVKEKENVGFVQQNKYEGYQGSFIQTGNSQGLPRYKICRFKPNKVVLRQPLDHYYYPRFQQFEHPNIRMMSPSGLFRRMRNNVFGR